jgi:hypothetical protein
MIECKICDSEFDLEAEGGAQGAIGILPCAFCPTCLNGVREMVEMLWPCSREHVDGDDDDRC